MEIYEFSENSIFVGQLFTQSWMCLERTNDSKGFVTPSLSLFWPKLYEKIGDISHTPADVNWWMRRSLPLRYMYRSFERLMLGSRKWTWSWKIRSLGWIRIWEILVPILGKECNLLSHVPQCELSQRSGGFECSPSLSWIFDQLHNLKKQ